MINKIEIILTPLTPIHIGNGREILPYEYIIKDEYMYKFDMMDIYSNLNENEKIVFLDYAEKDIIALRSFISEIYREDLGFQYKVEVCEEIANLYKQKINGSKHINEENSLIINEFINTIQKTYIPGSSLKGAIRSAYLYELGDNKKVFDYRIIKNNKGRIDGKSESWKYEKYEVELLECHNNNNKKEPKKDPFKSVKVSDSSTVDDALRVSDVNIYTYKYKEDTLKKGVPFYSLCTKSFLSTNDNCEFRFSINFFEGYYEKGGTNINITKQNILDSLNLKAYDMINRELDFYEDANYLETYNIYEKISSIYNELDKSKEALIRFGKGAGFDSTTFNLINNSRNNVSDSKSRSLVEGIYPLGWAVIKFV